MVAWTEYRDTAAARGALALEVFIVESTPTGDPEAVKAALPDHLAYQREMEEQGRLVLAGPVSDATGERDAGQGMIVYRAASMEEARAMAEADPMHASRRAQLHLAQMAHQRGQPDRQRRPLDRPGQTVMNARTRIMPASSSLSELLSTLFERQLARPVRTGRAHHRRALQRRARREGRAVRRPGRRRGVSEIPRARRRTRSSSSSASSTTASMSTAPG